jgi:hypothetical protein
MRWIRNPVVLVAVVAVASAGLAVVTTRSKAATAAEGCTRDSLQTAAGSYYTALVGHNASTLPWAPNAKITENGNIVTPNEGFFKNAGAANFVRVFYDTDTCSVQSLAVMNDGTRPAIVGGRFKLSGSQITESETLTTHSGDYLLFNPRGLINSDAARPDTKWDAAVPEAQRTSRERLIALADDYFSMFTASPSAVDRTPFQTNCDRWENGGRTSAGNCVFGGGAANGGDGKNNFISHRRYPFVDVEDGVVVGYVLFGSYIDFHMFKVVDGHVRLVNALVGSAGHTSSGWE